MTHIILLVRFLNKAHMNISCVVYLTRQKDYLVSLSEQDILALSHRFQVMKDNNWNVRNINYQP